MHELGGSGVSDKADEIAALKAHARSEARRRGIQMAKDKNIVVHLTTFA